MFVCSKREIAWAFFKEVIALRPEWNEVRECAEGSNLTEAERKKIKPMERIKMIMTRGKDDEKELYDCWAARITAKNWTGSSRT